jgi:hypothetical protein
MKVLVCVFVALMCFCTTDLMAQDIEARLPTDKNTHGFTVFNVRNDTIITTRANGRVHIPAFCRDYFYRASLRHNEAIQSFRLALRLPFHTPRCLRDGATTLSLHTPGNELMCCMCSSYCCTC